MQSIVALPSLFELKSLPPMFNLEPQIFQQYHCVSCTFITPTFQKQLDKEILRRRTTCLGDFDGDKIQHVGIVYPNKILFTKLSWFFVRMVLPKCIFVDRLRR